MSFLFEQLPLALQLRDDATFDNFFSGDNALLMDALPKQGATDDRYIYLFGPEGSGRSHLLQAACHQAGEQGLSALYLPLQELQSYDPEALFEGLEGLELICLDDIDVVAGIAIWEQQLFHLFNRLRDAQRQLLVAGAVAVRELPISLPDLASRLSWGSVFQLKPLADAELVKAVQLRAARRGLELNDEVAQFIGHRCQRQMEALLGVIEKLDHASLKERRRLTIPFVKSVMNW